MVKCEKRERVIEGGGGNIEKCGEWGRVRDDGEGNNGKVRDSGEGRMVKYVEVTSARRCRRIDGGVLGEG